MDKSARTDNIMPQKRRRQPKEAVKQTGNKIDLDDFEGVDDDFEQFSRDKFENLRRK